MAALDNHLLFITDLNEFERDYLIPMRNRRDKLWEDMKGCETPEAQREYDLLNSKVRFLENLVSGGKTVVRETAVIVEYSQKFLAAWEAEKPSGIAKSIKVLKEVIL